MVETAAHLVDDVLPRMPMRQWVLPARSPPQDEFAFNQDVGADDWPDLDQTAGAGDDSWD